jgi:hypothetical protein
VSAAGRSSARSGRIKTSDLAFGRSDLVPIWRSTEKSAVDNVQGSIHGAESRCCQAAIREWWFLSDPARHAVTLSRSLRGLVRQDLPSGAGVRTRRVSARTGLR